MLVTYGPVSLNLISVNEFGRQAVYMGKNYLYTKFRLGVRAYLNPSTQLDHYQNQSGYGGDLVPPDVPASRVGPIGPPTTTLPSGPVVGPPFKSFVPPPISDAALRHLLMTPRLQLQFSFLGVPSIQSPLPGFLTDATGGPIPVSCSVSQLTPKTWIVDWVVETDINETYWYAGTNELPLVLAQLWQMRHELDSNFFTARIIEGQTLFRVDGLIAGGATPDDFRDQLFVPPPTGFKRERIDIWTDAEEPGLIRFRVVDRQLPFGWAGAHITRLEAHHRIQTVKGNPTEQIVGGLLQLVDPANFALLGIAGDLKKIGALTFLGLSQIARGVYNSLPVSFHTVDIQAWGDPLSDRASMEFFARQVTAARLSNFFIFAGAVPLANGNPVLNVQGNPVVKYASNLGTSLIGAINKLNRAQVNPAGEEISGAVSPLQALILGIQTAIVPYGVDTSIDHDINGKQIHLSHTCISGPITTIFDGAEAVLNVSPMPLMEETFLNGVPLISSLVSPGPLPPNSNGTRGTLLTDVVSAALSAFNSLPPDIPAGDAPEARDLVAPLPLVI